MKYYKYVKILGLDEEILFYCNDLNKKNKIKSHLKFVINKNRVRDYKIFLRHKKYYNARVFYNVNTNVLGLISDNQEYFIFEDALRLNDIKYNIKYRFSGCTKGHHQFVVHAKNIKSSIETIIDLKVFKEKFDSYKLIECQYYKGINYIEAKTPLNIMMHFGNYSIFEKEYLKPLTELEYDCKIEKIQNDYKLIKIQID